VSLLALICLTVLFVRGSIFKGVRALSPVFLACPLCVGVWIGFVGFLLTNVSHGMVAPSALLPRFVSDISGGVETAVGALVVDLLIGLLEAVWLLIRDCRERLKS